jgi:HTH-type transcriptional regulator, glycine betaine synthesis regulator
VGPFLIDKIRNDEYIDYLPKELDDACLAVGSFIEYFGFKKIEGRIWTHTLLAKRDLCARDYMIRTGISKGLVSLSIARLVDYNVLSISKEVGKTQYYHVNIDIASVIKGVLRRRERKLLSQIDSSVSLLQNISQSESRNIDLKRLKYLKGLVNSAKMVLDMIIFTKKAVNIFLFGKVPKR